MSVKKMYADPVRSLSYSICVWDRSEARDAQGSTPLRNGCKFLRTSVVSFLVDWGADTTNVSIRSFAFLDPPSSSLERVYEKGRQLCCAAVVPKCFVV